MIRWTSRASTRTCDGMTRRDFLHAGALGALGLTMANLAALRAAGAVKKDHDERSCIMIFNLGGAQPRWICLIPSPTPPPRFAGRSSRSRPNPRTCS